jgi:hypothetical protein
MVRCQYISPLTSIVIALGITRLFTGLGQVLQLRGTVRLYWVHLLWIVNVFLWRCSIGGFSTGGGRSRNGPSFYSCSFW